MFLLANLMRHIFEKILDLLKGANIPYQHLKHSPTHTSEESAEARGESLDIGAKAMLMKADDNYSLFVLSASKKIDSKKIKTLLHARSLRFATPEELLEQTSLVPGSVPPFGRPILPFDLYVDHSIESLSRVAFNAGSLSDSIIMSTSDYLALCGGTLCSFSK
jgi:Ala-tRNA(Pro) deacylase